MMADLTRERHLAINKIKFRHLVAELTTQLKQFSQSLSTLFFVDFIGRRFEPKCRLPGKNVYNRSMTDTSTKSNVTHFRKWAFTSFVGPTFLSVRSKLGGWYEFLSQLF
jgi:hypothetical protein